MPEPDDLLYHYTTANGLLGIFSSRSIWATRAQFLNDSQEILHGMSLARTLLPEYESRHPAGTKYLCEYLDTVPIIPWIFIASWSENGDQLSQWRGYGGGGPAYSLAFDRRVLLDHAANTQQWRLLPCLYTKEEQTDRLRELLDTVYRQVEHGSYAEPLASELATSNPNSAQVFSNLLFGNLLPVVAAMKHPGFQEEKEWRLISPVTDANVKHRPGAQTIIPYLTFPLPVDTDGQMDIRETVIGPTGVAEETSCQAVRSLYVAWGYADIPNRVLPGIQPSRIPFRSW